MPTVTDNAIRIHYETLGNPEHPALLLVAGLGEQMIAWPYRFRRTLADNKLFVIRFDNRDTGLSTKIEDFGVPDLHAAWEACFTGRSISAPYALHDMAVDAAEFVLVSDWGHGLDYPELWPLLARHISRFVQIHSEANSTAIASGDSIVYHEIQQTDEKIQNILP